jgi:hypothetical protein
MNDERFEVSLRRAKIRPMPAHWRDGILAAARDAQENVSAPTRKLEPSAIPWIGWFWLRRWAWGGLAVAWVAIFTLNWAANRPGGPGAVEAVYSPGVQAMAMRQSQLLANGLDEIGRDGGTQEKQRPAVDRPRSARSLDMLAV